MLKKGLFQKPKNQLEGYQAGSEKKKQQEMPEVPDNLFVRCQECGRMVFRGDVEEHFYVCPHCGYHFKMPARHRIEWILDEGSFVEHDPDLSAENIIGFPEYEKKLEVAGEVSGEPEGVVCGTGTIKRFYDGKHGDCSR